MFSWLLTVGGSKNLGSWAWFESLQWGPSPLPHARHLISEGLRGHDVIAIGEMGQQRCQTE